MVVLTEDQLPRVTTLKSSKAYRYNDELVYPETDFTEQAFYYNGSKVPMLVTFRDGRTIRLKDSLSTVRTTNGFSKRVRYEWGHDVVFDADRLLDEVDERHSSPYQLAMKKTFENNLNPPPQFGGSGWRYHRNFCIVEHELSYEDLMGNGGSVYLHELDIVVSADLPGITRCPHPSSAVGKRLIEKLKDPMIGKREGLVYRVEIVDNNGQYGRRYININNLIYEVNPIKDQNRENGVHVYESSPVDADYLVKTIRKSFYTFAEADTALLMFPTIEEARTLGNLEASQDARFKEMMHEMKMVEQKQVHENTLLKQNLEATKLQNMDIEEKLKAKTADHAAEVRRLEHDKTVFEQKLLTQQQEIKAERERFEHERELFRMKRQDVYEERSSDRKDTTEFLKWIPAVLGVAVAVIVLL